MTPGGIELFAAGLPVALGAASVLAARRAGPTGARAAGGLFLGFLASLALAVVALDAARAFAPGHGWDARIYCAAVRAWDAGKSPYIVENLRPLYDGALSFSYPLVALPVLGPLCGGGARFTALHVACLGVAFALAAARRRAWAERAALAVLLVGAFAGAAFCFMTNNVGLLELAAFAACLFFLERGRLVAAGAALGVAASFKLVPLLLGAGFLFLDRPRRATAAAAALAVVVAALGVSWVMSPAFFHDYAALLVGRLPGQHAPILEGVADATNPTFTLALESAARRLPFGHVVLALGLGAMLVGMVVVLRRLRARGLDDLRLFSLATLFALLVVPRLKPYSLPFAALPVFHLTREAERSVQVGALLVAVWVPALLFNEGVLAAAGGATPAALHMWILTNQTTCLAVAAAGLAAAAWSASDLAARR